MAILLWLFLIGSPYGLHVDSTYRKNRGFQAEIFTTSKLDENPKFTERLF